MGITHPLLFSIAIILTLLSVSALGLIFASAFVLSRYAQVFTNGLEFPIYVISGSMFPIALLPFWVHPAAYALGPTWGIEAIRLAAAEHAIPEVFWVNLGVMLVITLVYGVLAGFLFRKVEVKSRRDGSLVEA